MKEQYKILCDYFNIPMYIEDDYLILKNKNNIFARIMINKSYQEYHKKNFFTIDYFFSSGPLHGVSIDQVTYEPDCLNSFKKLCDNIPYIKKSFNETR